MQYNSILAVIFGAAVLGSFIQSVSGFGYAIVLMSILPVFLSIQTASVLEVVTSSVMVCAIALRYWKNIRWRLIVLPMIANAVFGYIGICIQSAVPDVMLRKILGICLIMLSFWMMKTRQAAKAGNWIMSGLAAGTLSGIMGGLMSIGGPPMVLYCLSVTDSKEEYAATLQMYFFLSSIYLLLTHIFMGHLTSQVWMSCIAAVLGLGIGTVVGLKVFRKIRQDAFRKVVCIFMVLAGVYMLSPL
ncbi:MAG: sulfite exporter TauE/SafE family protein [Oribacterium sp.]|nr:sulfite exporter TauE/SafE family protein [Oribacterium sp.]